MGLCKLGCICGKLATQKTAGWDDDPGSDDLREPQVLHLMRWATFDLRLRVCWPSRKPRAGNLRKCSRECSQGCSSCYSHKESTLGFQKGGFGRRSPLLKFPLQKSFPAVLYPGRRRLWLLTFLRPKNRNEGIFAKTTLCFFSTLLRAPLRAPQFLRVTLHDVRKTYCGLFLWICLGICIEKWRGFWVNGLCFPRARSTKLLKTFGEKSVQIRGKIRDENSKNSGNFRSATFLT